MTGHHHHRQPPPVRRDRLLGIANRELTPDDFEAYVSAPMSEAERAEIASLITWFSRRHPSAADRLASVRRSMRNAERLRVAAEHGRARGSVTVDSQASKP